MLHPCGIPPKHASRFVACAGSTYAKSCRFICTPLISYHRVAPANLTNRLTPHTGVDINRGATRKHTSVASRTRRQPNGCNLWQGGPRRAPTQGQFSRPHVAALGLATYHEVSPALSASSQQMRSRAAQGCAGAMAGMIKHRQGLIKHAHLVCALQPQYAVGGHHRSSCDAPASAGAPPGQIADVMGPTTPCCTTRPCRPSVGPAHQPWRRPNRQLCRCMKCLPM